MRPAHAIETVSPQDVTPAILALFDLSQPTMPRAYSVLEGTAAGQILVDDGHPPRWAAVREGVYGTLYLGSQITGSRLRAAMDRFSQYGGVGIGCWLDDPLNALLPPNPGYDGRTLYFTERSRAVDLESLSQRLPNGYVLSDRDARWLAQSFDYESTLASFGSVESILGHTLGVVVVEDGSVVCEAATGAPTHGRIEVGVTTKETHRGQGLATLACARLIQVCEGQGYATWWDCAVQNVPSVRLARRLGYENGREYRYVWWDQGSPLAPTG